METTSHGHMSLVGAELEEEEEDIGAQAESGAICGFSTQVTGEEEQEHPEEVEDEADDPEAPWQYTVDMETGSPSESLAQMARSMLLGLTSDSQIVNIRHRDDFWLSTLSKMGDFFPAAQRKKQLAYYREILSTQWAAAYVRHCPSSVRSDRGIPGSHCSRTTTTAAVGSWGAVKADCLRLDQCAAEMLQHIAPSQCVSVFSLSGLQGHSHVICCEPGNCRLL
ncbi:hypothetical protein GDO81_002975 [Engystomops pustulosus]|uniref:Uncharacterized protein n=1 Tax=Engystomops pustulosus TaxID=76066 RepID=A0AAV7DQ01_ENGPU|nr:hypothetical protein GDO81_002975 [Engystomops pustulosus]